MRIHVGFYVGDKIHSNLKQILALNKSTIYIEWKH